MTEMTFHTSDEESHIARSKVTLAHENLYFILRMTFKTLKFGNEPMSGLALEGVRKALEKINYDSYWQLRERIRELARHRLGKGEALSKLEALIERCKQATEKRNKLVHRILAEPLEDGAPYCLGPNFEQLPLPTMEELRTLAEELYNLAESLNTARLNGFLSEALSDGWTRYKC